MKAVQTIGYWLKSLAVHQFSGWAGLFSSTEYLGYISRTHSIIFNVFRRQPGCVLDHSLPSRLGTHETMCSLTHMSLWNAL